jgi:hypothetical protein
VILRRLYLYLVSAAALMLLAAGLTMLGGTILLFVFNDPSADSTRGQLAVFTAMTVVAAPVWGVHFWFARHFALRDPFERASALRRLYLYWACLASAVAGLVALSFTLTQLLMPVLDNQSFVALTAAQDAWAFLVFLAIFAFHFRVAAVDRAAAGEEGTAATLRRWYMYPALLIGLMTMLYNAASLLDIAWTRLVVGSPNAFTYLSIPAGAALAGAALWGFHARVIATDYIAQDRHSTLRAVEGFLAVAASMTLALFGASQILYYALARVLGVSNPGGAGSNVLAAAAGPGSFLLVFGVSWFLIQRRLTRDAGTQEAERQAGVRRLYTNLAALVSLAVWSTGAGGLLWTLADQIGGPIIGVPVQDWKDPVSLWATLLVVGAAVWAAHWRNAPWATDRQSLSRKLYVWAALLGSILAVLAAGVGMLNALLQQVFSSHPTLQASSNLDVGHYLAVILVAAGVGAYHWRVLRADAAARPPKGVVAAPALVQVAAASEAVTRPQPVVDGLGPHARRYTLVVSDATDDDVHQALTSLPPQASYRLTPSDSPTNSEPKGVSSRGPREAVDGR